MVPRFPYDSIAYDVAVRIEPLGDSAYIVRDLGDVPSYTLAGAIERASVPGIVEIVPCFDTLGVYVSTAGADLTALEMTLKSVSTENDSAAATHSIPVCYELGEDLEEVASHLRMEPLEVIRLHTSQSYTCWAVGFVPGFPYLGYLPATLRGIERLATPRVRVPDGAVALTGDQTAIYPGGSPGGWRIIGRTPLTIVDVESGYFPIRAGDKVEFSPLSTVEFTQLQGRRL